MKFPLLYNFISPVTGRILSTPDYVLIGDDAGFATPSPIITDIRLDLIDLRYDLNFLSSASFLIGYPNKQLPNAQVLNNLEDGFLYNTEGTVSTRNDVLNKNLTYQYLWRGNQDNKAEEVKTIEYNNLPDLENSKLITGDSNNRPVATQLISIDNLPSLQAAEIEGIGAYQVWVGTNEGRPEPSYGVSIELAILTAKFETGAFIMRNGLFPSYPNAQFLTNLTDGLVKKISGGYLAHAVVGEDYMGMNLSADKLWIGNAQGKAEQRDTIKLSNLFDVEQDKLIVGDINNRPQIVSQIKLLNFPDITKNYLIHGDANGKAALTLRIDKVNLPALGDKEIYVGSGTEGAIVFSDVLKAKFVTMDTSKHQDLPNSVIIGNLENGLIAKQGENLVNASLTNKKIWIGDTNNKPIETDKLSIDNLPDLTSRKIFWGDTSNRPVESNVLQTKFIILYSNQNELPKSIKLKELENRFLAKSGDTIANATINYNKLITGDSNNKIIEIEKIQYSNFPDGNEDNLISFNSSNRPIQILTIKDKNMMPLPNGKIYFGSENTVPQVIGLQEKYLFTGDSGGNISSVLRLDIDNYVNLTNNHIHIGNGQNRPIEKDISEVAAPRNAKYIIQTSDINLPNAQSLDQLIGTTPKILKASSSGVIEVAVKDVDYATKEKLEEIKNETEQFKNQAEQAKTAAESAKTAAEAAKVEAQTQAGLAQGHALNAQTQALASQTSATASAASASAAAGSATAAAASATAAAGSAAAAAGSAASAASSEFFAGVSAAAAAGSAGAAGISAAAAAGSAEDASNYRDEAETFKNNAGYSAGQAEIFSLFAESYKNDALTYSTNSANSASASAASATSSANSATASATSATASEAALAAFLATNIVLSGDISGSGLPASPISTTFTPNPSFSGTGYLKPPVGTTAQRPASPAAAMIRFNSTTSKLEIYI